MVTKEQCIPETIAVVNDKVTRWNTDMGTVSNGLVCFPYSPKGVLIGEEGELPIGTRLVILSKPKEFNGNGNQVKFRIEGSDQILCAWWICFKHKVDIV